MLDGSLLEKAAERRLHLPTNHLPSNSHCARVVVVAAVITAAAVKKVVVNSEARSTLRRRQGSRRTQRKRLPAQKTCAKVRQ